MTTRTIKIGYYSTTGIITIIYLLGVFMYLTVHENITTEFDRLGFPFWLIIPMGAAKLLGVVALWLPSIPKWLREWAYAGIFFNAFLALGAHLAIGENDIMASVVLLLLVASRYLLFKLEE